MFPVKGLARLPALSLLLLLLLARQLHAEQAVLRFDWDQEILNLGLHDDNSTEQANDGCIKACHLLQRLLPVTTDSARTTAYAKEEYWSSRQAEVTPQCFVQPTTAEEVASIVSLVSKTKCRFAVKSGGHGAFAGASSIEAGLTIDLQLLNELSLEDAEQPTVTRVGPGNRWIDVYDYLTPRNLSVLGGRVAEVGVGGFTLGGGISFFSPKYGWALDGVRNYELVTPDARILQVNRDSYPDLYWALRGGGKNFGIVTRFDLETFPQGPMWGGVTYSDVQHTEEVIDAFEKFAFNAPQDLDAHAYIFLDFTDDIDRLRAGSVLAYARAVEYPEALGNFTKIPTVRSTLRSTDVADLAREISALNPTNMRWSYSTATFVVSKEMLRACVDIFIEEAETIKHREGVVPVLVLQLITKDVISRFSRNGGNCLGIEDGEGPLLLLNFPVKWTRAEDDAAVLGAAKRIRDRTTQRARKLGLYHRYLYQNYADGEQEVFASYGEENLKKLRDISRKYDPAQVFQKLQPGYFKL
ncbi:FAD binding domain protein [Neohortaea acidophila]|uniref:FAD binding domain protein n=1 Tax=Neohortaea acidophila TaxID=245834 RepID=A0A6A6PQX1_9PEZI|nr:FAD binding domain protein [Neohortaea acidophila]KAF2482459.1 FAD binding domain protein [Neohortaea acidophila]